MKKLCVATPAYGGMVHTDWHDSIMSMHANGIEVITMCLGNESLITRARNSLLKVFYSEFDVDHLLFLDADVGIDGKDVLKMMDSGYDVIGASVALKGKQRDNNFILNITEPKQIDDTFYEVTHLGTAVMMLSRKSINSLVQNAVDNNDVYYRQNFNLDNIRDQVKSGEYYDIFKVGINETGNYLSEDYYVCESLKRLGYPIIIDSSIKTRHNGNYVFYNQ